MKVRITGGAGFIGQRTGEHLMKQGHQVTILDNLSPPAHDGPPALPAGMELVEGDIRKREDWVKALKENEIDRKSTRLNSSHRCISYAVFCLKKKKNKKNTSK